MTNVINTTNATVLSTRKAKIYGKTFTIETLLANPCDKQSIAYRNADTGGVAIPSDRFWNLRPKFLN